MTFDDLCKSAPELIFLKQDAIKKLDPEDTDWFQYENLKNRMCHHVGVTARPNLPEWQYTPEAYEVAHRAIFGNLV